MKGQRIGYIRVSSIDQNPDRQLEGVEIDRVFIDKVSAKDVSRPELQNLLSFAREGDTIVVHSMDRLARNLDDLRSIVKSQTEKGIQIEFIKEGLTFSGEDSPMATLLLSVMGAFAEFERALIKERQREGIELAKSEVSILAGSGPFHRIKLKISNPELPMEKPKLHLLENSTSVEIPYISI